VPAKRPHDTTFTTPVKPGTGSSTAACSSRPAAENAAPTSDSKRHKAGCVYNARGAAAVAPGVGQPYYRDFDDLAAETEAAARVSPAAAHAARAAAPQRNAAASPQVPSSEQRPQEQQVSSAAVSPPIAQVKQEQPEQPAAGVGVLQPEEQAAQQEQMGVKQEPAEQPYAQEHVPPPGAVGSWQQQGQEQGAGNWELQHSNINQGREGMTEDGVGPSRGFTSQPTSRHGTLQQAMQELQDRSAQQASVPLPAGPTTAAGDEQHQLLEDLLDRRMCQGLANWPPAQVFDDWVVPGDTALQVGSHCFSCLVGSFHKSLS
jgi:hypothetical protein